MKKGSKAQPKKADNVRVCVRVRPLNTLEKQSGDRRIVDNLDNQVYLRHHKKTKCFSFDNVFDEMNNQESIFINFGKQMIEKFVQGYNCCIFAYGQTGAGKTYTMQGDLSDEKERGLMPRSLNYLFFLINEMLARAGGPTNQVGDESSEFIVKLTVIEIYNEVIYDLLSDCRDNKLNLREDIKKGVFLEGVSEEVVGSFSESRRGVGQQQVAGNSGVNAFQYSKFNFVDLAGSERQKHTKAKGKRLKEGCNINKSLTILGSVIYSLASKRKNQFVRYRDSKLTFLLKDSLGGNSKTVFIANVSPSAMYYVESLSTLLFAQRAKMIKNKAVINKDIKGGNVEMLRAELTKAKMELASLQEKYKVLEESQMSGIDMKSVSDSQVKEQGVKEGEQVRKVEEIVNQRTMVLENSIKDRYLILKETVRECLERLCFLSTKHGASQAQGDLKVEAPLNEDQKKDIDIESPREKAVNFVNPFKSTPQNPNPINPKNRPYTTPRPSATSSRKAR